MSYRAALDLIQFWKHASSLQKTFVLAEISRTEGSTYRKAGAKKIIAASGASSGLLSGGCLEDGIVKEALDFLAKVPNEVNESHEALFDTSHESDRLFGYQKGCSGKLWIRFSKLGAYSEDREHQLFSELQLAKHLTIWGCGVDTIALSELLGSMGIPHSLYDHRKDLVVQENFPKASRVEYAPPQVAAEKVRENDLVIIMSHNYEADLNFMSKLVQKSLSYVGFLGPRGRYEQMQADLKELLNVEWPSHLQQVSHSPIGLKMPCSDPHDIALSITAEVSPLLRS